MKSYSAKQTHLHNYQPIQTQPIFSQPNNMVMDLQRTFGNRATTQFMLSNKPQATGTVIQRTIDLDVIKKLLQTLGMDENTKVPILELPSDSKLKITNKMKELDQRHKLNIQESLNEKDIGAVLFPDYYENAQNSNDTGWLDQSFSQLMEHLGGAAYNHLYDLIVMTEKAKERDLLHEMGHFKQNKEYKANATNTHNKILEYHNVVLHENLYDDELRTRYSKDIMLTKDWQNDSLWSEMIQELWSEKNENNLKLLEMIDKKLQEDGRYKNLSSLATERPKLAANLTKAGEVKRNIAYEYFKTKTKS